jgi:hypothetical protein
MLCLELESRNWGRLTMRRHVSIYQQRKRGGGRLTICVLQREGRLKAHDACEIRQGMNGVAEDNNMMEV